MTDATAMFPLGSVTFPHSYLPLRVFEARYRILVVECLAGDGRFGTALIRRGSEVGGGDDRTDVGTMVQVLDATTAPDGSWNLLTIGVERIDVVEWLDDDPHPRAIVEPRPSIPPTRVALDAASSSLRGFLGLAVELGHLPSEPVIDIDADPEIGAWQLCAASPMGTADRQELLTIDDGDARMDRFVEMVDEQTELLRFRGPR